MRHRISLHWQRSEYISQIAAQPKDADSISDFQLIDKSDYAANGIDTDIASRKNFIYKPFVPNSVSIGSDKQNLLYIAPYKRSITIKIIHLPISAKVQEFGHYWRNPSGGLRLSKQGLQAFLEILRFAITEMK